MPVESLNHARKGKRREEKKNDAENQAPLQYEMVP